jgi:hypothetical protein
MFKSSSSSYMKSSGNLEEMQNSQNYHHDEGATVLGGGTGYRTTYTSNYVAPTTYAYESSKTITNGGISPVYTKDIAYSTHSHSHHGHTHGHTHGGVVSQEHLRWLRSQDHTLTYANDAAASDEMTHLNDMLSEIKMKVLVYTGCNRLLTSQLARLQRMESFKNFQMDVSRLQTRRVDTSHHESQLRASFAQYKAEADDLRNRYAMVDQTRTDQMTKIEALMQQMSQLDAQISLFRSQKVEFDSRYQLAMADGDMLSRELSRARAEMESERSACASFKAEVHHLEGQQYVSELTELKNRIRSFSIMPHTEVIQADLKAAVHMIRQEYEHSRNSLKTNFDFEINEIHTRWMSKYKQSESMRMEVAEMRAQADRLRVIEIENADLRASIAKLEQSLHVAESQNYSMEAEFSQKSHRWAELKRMLEAEQLAFGSKSKLYGEVVIYRDILEGRADFLEHGSSHVSTHAHDTHTHAVAATRSARMHSFQNQTQGMHLGNISLHIVDWEGRNVVVKNVTTHDMSLSGWRIVQSTAHGSSNEFTFPHGIVIRPGQKLTIWSNDQGEQDHLPDHIVFHHGAWFHEKRAAKTMLYDDHGKEQATYSLMHSSQDN